MAGFADTLNKTIGTVYNAAGAATAVIDSVNSIFGGASGAQGSGSLSSINRLRSQISKTDILSNNLFYVRFGIPTSVSGVTSQTDTIQQLSLLCHSASLPGVAFATSDVRRYGMGVTEKMPTFPIFTDLSLSFIGDGQGVVRSLFTNWMNGVIQFNKPGGSSPTSASGVHPFEVSYKSDYSVPLEIIVLNRANREVMVTKISQAYPIALGDQQLSWQDMDSLMTIPVTFTYYNWTTDAIRIPETGLNASSDSSLLGKLVKVGTALQTLASIRKPQGIGDIVNVARNASSVIAGLKGL